MNKGFKTAVFVAGAVFAISAGCGYKTAPNAAPNNSQTAGPTTQHSPSKTPTPDNIKTGEPTPVLNPLPPDARAVQDAINIVHLYYAAINAREFRKAYELWSGKGEASKQTFEQFRDGFGNTASVEIDTSGEPGDLEGAAGSQYVIIPLRIKAKTKDGEEQNFVGEYVLRRSMVDGATAEQRAWRIYSADIKKR